MLSCLDEYRALGLEEGKTWEVLLIDCVSFDDKVVTIVMVKMDHVLSDGVGMISLLSALQKDPPPQNYMVYSMRTYMTDEIKYGMLFLWYLFCSAQDTKRVKPSEIEGPLNPVEHLGEV